MTGMASPPSVDPIVHDQGVADTLATLYNFRSRSRHDASVRHLLLVRLQGRPSWPLQRRRALHRPSRRRRARRQGGHPDGDRDRHLCPARRAREPHRERAAGGGSEAWRPPADGRQGLPGLLLSLLGRHQGGDRAGAAEHAAAGGGLRLPVRGFGLQARGLFERVRTRGRAGAEAGVGQGRHGRCLPRRDGQGLAGSRGAACLADRRLLLALFLGLDRSTQGRRAPAARHGGDERTLWRARPGHARGRRQLLRRQALLRLWAGQLHDLPVVDREHRGAGRPPADARHGVRDDRGLQAHALLRPADIFRRWKEKTGTVILDGIGSTECLHIFIGNRLDDYRPGTSGKPVPGYEVKIVDENGKPVAKGESGRLWIRSESAAKYYWNKPEKTAETMVDGWLNTGDTYRQDEDGYFIYDGRSDDMLKGGGIWCSPVEVENCLIGHTAVLEAAVVGHADAEALIKPKAIVVLKQAGGGGPGLTDELMALCKKTLAPYKYPRWVEYVAELPKTAT